MARRARRPHAPRPPETDPSAPSEKAPSLERQLSEFEAFSEIADAMRADIQVVVVRLVAQPYPHVVLFFCEIDVPDVLFAYQCMPPGRDRHEHIWLAEELATGGLHRLMQDGERLADADGVVWIQLREGTLVAARAT